MFLCSLLTSYATVSVKATVQEPQAVFISHLSYQPQPFNPNEGEAEIFFSLSKPAYVSGVIYDHSGIAVKTIGPYLLSGGPQRLYWNGRISDRKLVRSSWYTLALSAEDDYTSHQDSLEIAVSYGKALKINNLTVSPKRFRPLEQEVTFKSVLSRDAYVTLQIVKEDGTTVLLHREMFWTQGLNSYSWDGYNSHGVPAEPGTYLIYLTGVDPGGNQAEASQTVVVLNQREPLGETLLNLLNRMVGSI